MRTFRSLPLATLLALTGCGFNSSPADNLTFKAPAGWQGSPGIMGFMQFWKAPNGNKEVLMLFKSPKPLEVHDVFNSANMKDARVETEKPISICGNQSAEYIKAQGTTSSNDDSTIEMVMTKAAGTTYLAMYIYPVRAAPNAEAGAALRQLCPK